MSDETTFDAPRKPGKKMPDGELLALIRAQELASMGSAVAAGATISTSVFPSQQTMTTLEIDRYNALNAFFARPLGNEVENRSQIVIPELRDTIQWIMPQLMRIFAANPEVFRFDPEGPNDTGQAQVETAAVNHVFMKENPGFLILHDFFWDAMLMRNGYVEVYFKKFKDTTTESYTGITQIELPKLLGEKDEEKVEVLEQREYSVDIPQPNGDPLSIPVFDLKLRRTKTIGKVIIEGIPAEEMRISPRVRGGLDDSPFSSHVTEETRSNLIAEGYKRSVVDSLPSGRPNWWEIDALARNQVTDQLSAENPTDRAMQEIEFHNVVMRVDVDGDGIAELRQIIVAGDKILSNEEIEETCFASGHAIRMPHRHTGISLYDLLMDLQVLKSTLFRQGIDNLAIANQTRIGADWKTVNIDDLLTVRPGGVVRTNGPPQNSLMPIEQPSNLVQQVIPALEYCDGMREMRTGVGHTSMGLEADELADVTKGGQLAAMSAASLKIELIARLLAEGVVDIAKKIHGVLQRHQDQPLNFQLAGKWVEVDPTSWRRRTRVSARVGLGSGNREEARANIAMVGAVQEKAAMFGLVGPKQMYNTSKEAISVLGFENPEKYVMDPDSPEYQQFKASQPPPQPPPQVQAAQIRAQTDMQKAQVQAQGQVLDLKRKLIEAQGKIMAEKQRSETELMHAAIQAQHDRQHEAQQGAHDRMVQSAGNADAAHEQRFEALLKAFTQIATAQLAAKTQVETASMSAVESTAEREA